MLWRLHLPVMVPDPDVATPLRLWASQENVLVLFKPGWNKMNDFNSFVAFCPEECSHRRWNRRPATLKGNTNTGTCDSFLSALSNTLTLSAGHRRLTRSHTAHCFVRTHHASIVSRPEKWQGAWLLWRIVREKRKEEGAGDEH